MVERVVEIRELDGILLRCERFETLNVNHVVKAANGTEFDDAVKLGRNDCRDFKNLGAECRIQLHVHTRASKRFGVDLMKVDPVAD